MIPVLILCILVVYALMFPVTQPDHFSFLIPWLQGIKDSDGLSVFATAFTNYTGGYVSILAAMSLLSPTLSDLAIIKGTAILGTMTAALGMVSCLRVSGWQWVAAINGGLMFMLLPGAMINGVAWGQADAFYAALVLFSLAAVLGDRPLTAGLVFAAAISIKLQAILFAPFMIGYLLRTPAKLAVAIVALPLIYMASNGLYLVAGRPLAEVALIYSNQAQTYHGLSMNAGNLWLMVDMFRATDPETTQYKTLVVLGLGMAVCASVVLIWLTARTSKDNKADLIFLAALTTLVLPFILPKMHERFFYMAEALIFLAFLMDRKFLPAAICSQLSALCMYSIYHDTLGVRAVITWPAVSVLGLFFMIATLVYFLQAGRQKSPLATEKQRPQNRKH